jgi:hypothetical protein
VKLHILLTAPAQGNLMKKKLTLEKWMRTQCQFRFFFLLREADQKSITAKIHGEAEPSALEGVQLHTLRS